MNNAKSYNKNMIPSIIFGQYGWNFVFIDVKNSTYYKSEAVTKTWLKKNLISEKDFVNYCWTEYYTLKDSGIETGIVSYFTKDDEKIFNFAKNINISNLYDEVFDF